MSSLRSSSDRLGPSPSGRTEVMETGFSSLTAALSWVGPKGAGGKVASRVSIAASVVVGCRTPPVPALQGRISAFPRVQTFQPSLTPAHDSRAHARASRGARLRGVLALGDLLDDLRAEGGQIVRLARARQALVDVDLLVDPRAAGVLDVGLQRRPGGDRAAAQHVGLDQGPRAVADHADRLGLLEEGAHEAHRVLV